jgi:hypothetical protein
MWTLLRVLSLIVPIANISFIRMKGELSGVVGRVFADLADPIGSGFAVSLALPGGRRCWHHAHR